MKVKCLICRDIISPPESGNVECTCFKKHYNSLKAVLEGLKDQGVEYETKYAVGKKMLEASTGIAFKEIYGYSKVVALGPYEVIKDSTTTKKLESKEQILLNKIKTRFKDGDIK